MSLETLSHIFGITGVLAALFFAYLAHRKRLLNTGLTIFRDQYRIEMDDFKKYIRSDINMFREMMNENDARHTKALETIANYYKDTNDSVRQQANVCRLIQVEAGGTKKLEDSWKERIKSELETVQDTIDIMKKDVDHIRKSINGKK